jgi:hypothetical protein
MKAWANYSPPTLPEVQSVEIVRASNVYAARLNDYMKNHESPGVVLEGQAAAEIAALWRELPSLPEGQQGRCHVPPFGIRFFTRSGVAVQGTICWKCNNIYGDELGRDIFYIFDGQHPQSRLLLQELSRHFPSGGGAGE